MARTTRKKFQIDLRPAIEYMGFQSFLEQVGVERILEHVGVERILDCICRDPTLTRQVVRALVKRLGIDGLLAAMSPAQRRELRRRLHCPRRALAAPSKAITWAGSRAVPLR